MTIPGGSEDIEHGRAPHRGARPARVLGLVVAVLAVAFVAHAARWVAAPLGDSHDGRNGAAWALAARSLRDDPIGHRLGGIRPDGEPYANHPPGIVAATAVTTLVTGDRPVGVRLPAVLATIASLALLAALLQQLRYPLAATIAGLGLAATSPMLLGYGTMLDTPMVGLPAFLGALLVAVRCRQGHAASRGLAVAVGAATGLLAWQAVLGTWLVALWLVAVPASRARNSAIALRLASGALGGALVSLAWAWWAYGSPGALFDALQTRSGGSTGWLDAQVTYLGATFGWARLAIVALGAAAALASRRRIGPIAVALATTVLWTVGLREGATIHGYWSYFGIVVVALGAAAVAERAIELSARATSTAALERVRPLMAAVAALALGIGFGSTLLMTNAPETATIDGLDAGRLAERIERADRPDEVVMVVLEGNVGGGTTPLWASWPTHGAVAVIGQDEVTSFDDTYPGAVLMVEAASPWELAALLDAGAIDSEGLFVLFSRAPGT